MNAPSSNFMPQVGFTLPRVGEDHPLRKRFRRTFLWSATDAMLIAVVVAGTRIAVSRHLGAEAPPNAAIVREFRADIMPIAPYADVIRSAVPIATQAAQLLNRIPEPVPDYDAKDLTVGPLSESAASSDAISSLTGGVDSLAGNVGDTRPSPDEYVAVEELPKLINQEEVQRATQDLYPEIAKAAGVEGIVNLKVYVGKTGDVENVMVVDGPPMLRDAAKQAVKVAKFKPALQQHHAVGIWVAWPLEFSLQS